MSYRIDGVFTSYAVNGQALGLYGDGIHDDTTILNSILQQHKRVYLPAGIYIISRTIVVPAGVEVFGEGAETKIQLASSYTLTGITWRTTKKYPYVLLDSNTILKNVLINGDETTAADQGQVGIMAHGDNIIIENVKTNNVNYFPEDWIGGSSGYGTVNAPGYGIQVLNASNVTVRNCVMNGNGYEGIGTEACKNVIIENCKVGDGNRTGIQIHRGSKHVTVSWCVVENHSENKGADIIIHGENTENDYIDDLKIIGCSCVEPSNGKYGIQTVTGYERNVVIDSCRIKANSFAIITANDLAENVQNTKNIVITGNIIDSDGKGIEVRGDICVICDNIIHSVGEPISVTGSSSVIANNLTD